MIKPIPPNQPTPRIPREVVAACREVGRTTEELLAWAVRDNEVVLILASGAKLRVRRQDPGTHPAKRRKA